MNGSPADEGDLRRRDFGMGARHRSRSNPFTSRVSAHRKHNGRAIELQEGDHLQVFSRTINEWVPGSVVEVFQGDFALVGYAVGETQLSKVIHATSNHIIPHTIAESLDQEHRRFESSLSQQQEGAMVKRHSDLQLSQCLDTCIQAINEGDHVQVFSRSAAAWLLGEVAELSHDDFLHVHYKVGQRWFRKELHVNSEHLKMHQQNDLHLRPLPGQGCRVEDLPPECNDDPKKYYIDMDYIWSLLEKKDVVLVKGSWLLERGAAIQFEPLECRQDLPLEAMVDTDALRKSHDVKRERFFSSAIVAISHCWLSADHPDPEGHLLKSIMDALRSEEKLKTRLEGIYSHEDLSSSYFFAWCSLFQPYHAQHAGAYRRVERSCLTETQTANFQRSLECMDIWYAHAQTRVWLLTKYFPCQGAPYDERGWPTWERLVSCLVKEEYRVTDFEKGNCARRLPMLPGEFDRVIEKKRFTAGNADRELIKKSYKRNFQSALACCTTLCCDQVGWSTDSSKSIIEILKLTSNLRKFRLVGVGIGDDARAVGDGVQHCSKLARLELGFNKIGNDGAAGLAEGLQYCHNLRQIELSSNQIGDDGARGLVKGLQHCRKLEDLGLASNQIGDDGARKLGEGLQHWSKLKELCIGRNKIGDDGARGLGIGLQHCSSLMHIYLHENEIGDDGARGLVEGLQHCSELEELQISYNRIGDDGATALGEGLRHCSKLESLMICSQYWFGDDGTREIRDVQQFTAPAAKLDFDEFMERADRRRVPHFL